MFCFVIGCYGGLMENIMNEENENLINQEPDFITFGDYPEEAPEVSELEAGTAVEDPEEAPEVSELEASTAVSYSQDFQILENIGYFQLFFLGTLTIFFLLWLVCKFFNSFF